MKKLAFVHFAKAAGRHVNGYLTQELFRAAGRPIEEHAYKCFNSWDETVGLKRDWNETELLQLARNQHALQFPSPAQIRRHHALWSHDYLSRQYVHNHHHAWTANALSEFRRNGWRSLMFVRDPAELLCSLWTWARLSREKGVPAKRIIQPVELLELDLDAFLARMVGEERFNLFFALPDYTDQVDFVCEYSEENFSRLLSDWFQHDYRPTEDQTERRFSSGNPGYAAYRQAGRVSDATDALLQSNPQVTAVRERIAAA